jgi:ABC-type amino acid transport substrate-binding protein
VKTPQREKDFRFVGPLFETRYQILARQDDPALAFTSLDQLRAARIPIMVIRGSGTANCFQGISGLEFTDAPTAVEATLQQLKAGHGRLFGYYDLGNDWFLDSFQFRGSLAALPISFDLDTQWLCASSTLPSEQVAKLSAALEAAKKTPEWQAVMRKWFPGRQ